MKHFIKYTIILLASLTSFFGLAQTVEQNIRTGYPVYYVAANADGSNLYFYNKLNSYNTGLYAYRPADSTTTHLNIGTAIGDVVYNPFQNHFLISRFEPESAKILVLNADNNDSIGEIDLGTALSGAQFAKEMFVSPKGQLVVCANMNYSSGRNPSVFIYDADDSNYSLINRQEVNDFNTTGYNVEFPYYASYFDFNSYDSSVYISMAVQDSKLMPYNSQSSSLYRNFDSIPLPVPPGKLLAVDDSVRRDINIADFPGKLICPVFDESGDTSQYFGKAFIIGEKLHVYNYITPSPITSYPHYFLEMTYSSFHDKLFAVKEDATIGCPEDRRFEIWAIYYNENGLQIQQVMTSFINSGQIASLFYNPYDRRMYVYRKTDNNKLGREEVQLMSFDPASPNAGWETETLGIKSYFPDYDHTRDLAQFYYYNMTTPYINPYTNKIYLPNGGHSNVSVVGFEARETLTLRASEDSISGITWLSIPRHMRLTTPELTPTDTVFNENKISGDLINLNIEYNYIDETYPAGGENLVHAIWGETQPPTWSYEDSVMRNINSTRGYIVKHRPNETKTLTMYGSVEDPNASMDLYCKKDNWIGYFLYREQNVFDALAGIIDSIYHIQHQDYNCWRYNFPVSGECATKSQTDYSPGTWVCNGKSPTIKYGEMIMVKPLENIYGFQWYQSGYSSGRETTQGATYYIYQEEARYSTFVIELDSTSENPQEIGAFVNDTCVGASRVETTDSVVVLSAYLGSRPGDSVVFENYYGPAKSVGMKIKDYYVRTPFESQKVKRAIKTGGKPGVYIISFSSGSKEPELPMEGGLAFDVYPNPASGSLFYRLTLNDDVFVYISITDITGKLVAEPVRENMQAGMASGKIALKAFSGEKLKPGIYLLRVKAGELAETKKVIVK